MEGDGEGVNKQESNVEELEEKLCQLIVSDEAPVEDEPQDAAPDAAVQEPEASSPPAHQELPTQRYSRKVFVGGLPPDIDEEGIISSFQRFGSLVADWPYKAQCRSYFPPKGYAFLLFENEKSVEELVKACVKDDERLQFWVSSPSISHKSVQIRPWKLSDNDYVLDRTVPVDPRKTVFVGGLPRTLSASEVAQIMSRLYGTVCYAGIDTDPELRYPKGTASVAFSDRNSYIEAIKTRFVTLRQDGRKCTSDKRVEIKPYIWDDQNCDNCLTSGYGTKPAHFFCSNISCLRYYCLDCWLVMHARPDIKFHSPDYIRRMSTRWS
ncbi:RNA recognition motif. (a.k.a. RRM, RBD, or RNP domain) [Nesidiocoris tenuis]|uniref:RNA recognition motif. (A.k.a. RRM, RBD, or RNP domain) n=1 Tax=Nesidiocoris tenuis TaxID=355587 RepID=A0ABN7ASJ6_9HEMI|nr:RNA recognition motif. (a.k.a. RRM, RBD, or RNP domain) [Nesidiocoris tenuis]